MVVDESRKKSESDGPRDFVVDMSGRVNTTERHSDKDRLSTEEEIAPEKHENSDYASEEEPIHQCLLCNRRGQKRFMRMLRTYPQVDMETIKETMISENRASWDSATKEELKSPEKKTLEVVENCDAVNIIRSKWVLRVKRVADVVAERYKERLVVCEHKDQAKLSDTFAPVVEFSIVRLLLSFAAQGDGRFTK